jgi:hypothetical protein
MGDIDDLNRVMGGQGRELPDHDPWGFTRDVDGLLSAVRTRTSLAFDHQILEKIHNLIERDLDDEEELTYAVLVQPATLLRESIGVPSTLITTEPLVSPQILLIKKGNPKIWHRRWDKMATAAALILCFVFLLANRVRNEEAVDLLESKGLTRDDTGFVLKSEAVARSRFATLQSRAAEWNQADVTVRQIQGQLAYLKELDQAVINVNGQIGQLNFAIGQFPATWVRGRWFHGDNNLENDQYNLLVAQKAALVRTRDAELIPERDTLRGQQPGRNLNEAINERRTRQEAAVEALRGLREAVATTQRGYEALPNDPEVKRSLAAVGQAGLVPSPDFLQVVREHQLSESSAAHLKLIDAPGR